MDTMSATKAANGFGSLLDSAIQGRTTKITRHGKDRAVIVPIKTYRLMEAAQANADSIATFSVAMLRSAGHLVDPRSMDTRRAAEPPTSPAR